MTLPVPSSWPLLERLTGITTPDDIFGRFVEHVAAMGLSLYTAQEEAILEVMAGKHVVLNTPTGSGKSLVATAMIFKAMAEKKRAFYTCPIKALVSEKFFNLARDFGPDNVGMMTGDAAINRDAPVVCCTAEILSNMVLRQGDGAPLHTVIMDEFHYYADRERGVAWQIPLLVLKDTTFLLMSATLGSPEVFAQRLLELTGREAAVVRSDERPVPLDYVYSEKPLHETVDDLIKTHRYPIYLVNFTQRAAAEEAQNLMSVNFSSKEEKQAIAQELQGVKFASPYGKEIQKFLKHGLGIHHAGLLPKYRLVTEKLAQQGLLKIISGTDTLGVGVNIPIRTVLFTKLCKYDGVKTAVLSVRDFKQIAGRAGRKGFDDQGSVVAQAPEHIIENLRLEAKRAVDPNKFKKVKKAQPPDKGYVHWDRQTFEKLISRPPEELPSRFAVSHGMLVHLVAAKVPVRGGGYGRLMDLVARSHGDERHKRAERRRARQLFQSLRNAGILEVTRVPMAKGAVVEVKDSLQKDFSLNHTLGLYLLETLELLDKELGTYPLDVLTLVESILENPDVILYRQLDKLKGEKVAEMKANGVEYDQRMEELQKLEYPKPQRDFIYGTFNAFSAKHPWVGSENIRPKSVAREMFEKFCTFNEYVKEYELQRSEGLLLRYITDVYRTLTQNVPDAFKNEEVLEAQSYLRNMVHEVDKSLLEEWEGLKIEDAAVPSLPGAPARAPLLADNPRMLRARVRGELHRLIKALSLKDHADAAECLALECRAHWTPELLDAAMRPYWTDCNTLRMDHDARSPRLTLIKEVEPRLWEVKQTLLDPAGDAQWFLDLTVDLRTQTGLEGPLLQLHRVAT